MKASFVALALLGCAQATRLTSTWGCQPEPEPVATCGCAGSAAGAARNGFNLGDQNAELPAAERAGSFAKLTSESAGSQTQIGAQNIVIPDKHTVTDQAKVSEAQSRGSKQAQNCEVAKRTFDIQGSISVTEKYNDSSKGEHCASKEGEGASQTRSRTQVQNNLCARADIPCTCAPSCAAAKICSCAN